jgi:outer membrane protein assembly factor BamB
MSIVQRWKIGFVGLLALGVGVIAFSVFRTGRPGVGRMSGGVSVQRPETELPQSVRESPALVEQGIQVVSGNEANSIANENSQELVWNRFRGRGGRGISEERTIPVSWSDSENLRWKLDLPGPGSSSPILTEKYVFLTSYTGYGDEKQTGGKMDLLKRHLHCIDRTDGKLRWTKSVNAVQPEDPYQGMGIPEHGYATNTPTTDGEYVYAFFGKSGLYAYDLDGNEQWNVSVGTESGNRGWGTASSLLLYKDMVIVNASEESQSLMAFDRRTGKTVWSSPASTLELAYGTPTIVRVNETRDDLVIAVPGEVWGLNPLTGKLVWYAEMTLTGNLSPSVIQDGDMLYVFGGYRSSGSLALRTGGVGDVTKSHIAWTSRNSSYVVTPVLHEGHLYWIDDQGMYFCAKASTGELVQKKRVPGIESKGRPIYASPILVDGKIYAQTRGSGLFVIAGEPEMKILHQNKFESDHSVFNGTPAVSNGQLFLRSYASLYCVESKTKR